MVGGQPAYNVNRNAPNLVTVSKIGLRNHSMIEESSFESHSKINSEKGISLQDFTSVSENTPSKPSKREEKKREIILKSTLKKESTTSHM